MQWRSSRHTGGFDDFGQAPRKINESAYGLQAGIFARDVNRISHAYEELKMGGVIAGYAIEEMTELSLLVKNLR